MTQPTMKDQPSAGLQQAFDTGITSMTAHDLEAMRRKLDETLEQKRKEERRAALEALAAMMEDKAVTVEDLSAFMVERAKRRVPVRRLEAQFRDPATGATWSGRGKMANWLIEYIKQGRKLEEFALPNATNVGASKAAVKAKMLVGDAQDADKGSKKAASSTRGKAASAKRRTAKR